MRYQIRHTTRFEYSDPIRESVMELRMQPRTDAVQRCLEFDASVTPEVRPSRYTDYTGNTIHHFDIPSVHDRLEVTATSLVDVIPSPEPTLHIPPEAWTDLDALRDSAEHWEWLHPSHFAHPSELLSRFAEEIHICRRDNPLTVLEDLHDGIAKAIKYERGSTKVDSPIDDCLKSRKGVCQDFTHVFITLARGLGIPTRYVSGYLFHLNEAGGIGEGTTHAWAEAFVPGAGWVGFDSSNRMHAGVGHVRVAVGRDYNDVPPTRGTFKGIAKTALEVKVTVNPG